MRILFINIYIVLLLLIVVTIQSIHALLHRTYMHVRKPSRIHLQMQGNSGWSFDRKDVLDLELPTKDRYLAERFLKDLHQAYLLENVVDVSAPRGTSNIDKYAAKLLPIPILGLGIVFPKLDFIIDNEKSGIIAAHSTSCSLDWLKIDTKKETSIDFSVNLKLWIASDRNGIYSSLSGKKRPIGGRKVKLTGYLQYTAEGELPSELRGVTPAALDTAAAFAQKRIKEFSSRGLQVRLRKAFRVYVRRHHEKLQQQLGGGSEDP